MTAVAERRAAPRAGSFAGIAIALGVEDEGWASLGLGDVDELAGRCFAVAAGMAGLPADIETEIGLTLADDAAVRALNARWRGKDKPTNILSFPILELRPGERPGPMLGDLVLARETLEREAAAEGKPLRDHFCHLVVHGMLHCLGYDHETEAEAEAMEALETRILAGLCIPDPYRDTNETKEPIRA